MAFKVDDRVQTDLSFLTGLPVEQLSDFGGIALDFIRRGANAKLYGRAASRVGVEPEVVERSVVALAKVFVDVSKARLDPFSLRASLAELPFSEEASASLHAFLTTHSKEIAECAKRREMGLKSYAHLDWRLDVEVASRTVHRQVRPTFLLRLDTEGGGEAASELLQSDCANLKRLQAKLEAAEADMKGKHASRMARYIK
eukprot:g1292.t1